MAKANTFATGRWQPPHIGVAGLVRVWFERRRGRRDLLGLNDQMLHDIGVTWLDVQREIDKPFWRP